MVIYYLLLLGKESNSRPNKTDINLISDFNGLIINEESIPEACARILFEKTMNMIIEPDELELIISNNKLPYIINLNEIIFIYKIDYESNKKIPNYYNRIYKYLTLCMAPSSTNEWLIESCPLGFLDKSELYWTDIQTIPSNYKLYKKIFLKRLLASLNKAYIL